MLYLKQKTANTKSNKRAKYQTSNANWNSCEEGHCVGRFEFQMKPPLLSVACWNVLVSSLPDITCVSPSLRSALLSAGSLNPLVFVLKFVVSPLLSDGIWNPSVLGTVKPDTISVFLSFSFSMFFNCSTFCSSLSVFSSLIPTSAWFVLRSPSSSSPFSWFSFSVSLSESVDSKTYREGLQTRSCLIWHLWQRRDRYLDQHLY